MASQCLLVASLTESNKAESIHISSEDSSSYNDLWVVDSGATQHFSGHKEDFSDYKEIRPTLIHGMNLSAVGVGSISFEVSTTIGNRQMKVQNVLYVPDLMKSPTKVTRLYSHRGGHDVTYGYPTFVYTKDSSWLEFDNFKVMLDSNSNRNLFTMKTSIVHPNDDISLFAATSRPT